MDVSFDCCPYTKKEAQEALNRLVKYFKENKDTKFFGLDDLGIIDVYLNWPK